MNKCINEKGLINRDRANNWKQFLQKTSKQ